MFNLPLANEGGWVWSRWVLVLPREHNGAGHANTHYRLHSVETFSSEMEGNCNGGSLP